MSRLPLAAIVLLAGCAAAPVRHPPAVGDPRDCVLKLRAIFLDAGRVREASALVVDASGLLVAPRQVTDGADVIDVDLGGASPRHVTAGVLYEDPAHDLVVLLVDATGLRAADLSTVGGTAGRAAVTAAGWTQEVDLVTDGQSGWRAPILPRDGELGSAVMVDGRVAGVAVAREGELLVVVDAAAVARLRDRAIEDANAGRATPFSPGVFAE